MMKILVSLLVFVFGLSAVSTYADTYHYDIKVFGSSYVIITVFGNDTSGLSITPIQNKKGVKISGVSLEFEPLKKEYNSSVISSVKQVHNKQITDLVIFFTQKAQITATAGVKNIRIMVNLIENDVDKKNHFESKIDNKQIRITQANSCKLSNPLDFKGITLMGKSLSWLGYVVDFILVGNMEMTENKEQEKPFKGNDNECKDLTELVKKLSKEIMRLQDSDM